MMNIHPNKSLALATASLLAVTLLADHALAQQLGGQQPSGEAPRRIAPQQPAVAGDMQSQKPAPRILKQSEVIGKSVSNHIAADAPVTLGSISDLVVDSQTGQVRYAILISGEKPGLTKKQTAIRWDQIACDAKAAFTMSLTAEDLARMPSYEPGKLDLLSRDVANAAGSIPSTSTPGSSGVGEAPAIGKPSEPQAVGAAAMTRPTWLFASQMAQCPVIADKDDLGVGVTLLLEPKHGQVAFVGLAIAGEAGIGDSNCVIPWQAIAWVAPVGKTAAKLQVGKSKLQLAAAPKLEEEGADINKAAFRHKLYAFYGVRPFAFEQAKPVDMLNDKR